MPWITRFLIAVVSGVILLLIIQLVRSHKLDERRAVLWIFSGIVMLLAPLLVPGIDRLSRLVGIDYPPAFIFLISFFMLFFIVLQYAVTLTRLTKQNRKLAERLAILENELKQKVS